MAGFLVRFLQRLHLVKNEIRNKVNFKDKKVSMKIPITSHDRDFHVMNGSQKDVLSYK